MEESMEHEPEGAEEWEVDPKSFKARLGLKAGLKDSGSRGLRGGGAGSAGRVVRMGVAPANQGSGRRAETYHKQNRTCN